jgi:hypothetical protein
MSRGDLAMCGVPIHSCSRGRGGFHAQALGLRGGLGSLPSASPASRENSMCGGMTTAVQLSEPPHPPSPSAAAASGPPVALSARHRLPSSRGAGEVRPQRQAGSPGGKPTSRPSSAVDVGTEAGKQAGGES